MLSNSHAKIIITTRKHHPCPFVYLSQSFLPSLFPYRKPRELLPVAYFLSLLAGSFHLPVGGDLGHVPQTIVIICTSPVPWLLLSCAQQRSSNNNNGRITFSSSLTLCPSPSHSLFGSGGCLGAAHWELIKAPYHHVCGTLRQQCPGCCSHFKRTHTLCTLSVSFYIGCPLCRGYCAEKVSKTKFRSFVG